MNDKLQLFTKSYNQRADDQQKKVEVLFRTQRRHCCPSAGVIVSENPIFVY